MVTAIKSGDQTRGSCAHFKDGQFTYKIEYDRKQEQPESKR